MATSSWTTGVLHTTDAEFRTWGSELSTKLQAFSATPGLTKTADTGQINWATVTRPAANTDAGYEVYYLNDSLNATAPIYFKIYYGTNTNTTNPRIRIEIGTGSNGSGTLSGLGSGTVYIANSASTNATSLSSYACVNTGFVGLSWKSSAGALGGGFIICRTCDTDGTPNAKGAILLVRNSAASGATPQGAALCLRYETTATAYSIDTGGNTVHIPQALTSSTLQNGDKQVFIGWGTFPDVRPLFGFANTIKSESTYGSTISVALVGSSARTYIILDNQTNGGWLGHQTTNGVGNNYAPVMLYE